jgi:hypothetical protein
VRESTAAMRVADICDVFSYLLKGTAPDAIPRYRTRKP